MPSLKQLARNLTLPLRRKQVEDGMNEELRFHLEKEIERNRAAGMTEGEARRAALISFGGVQQAKEAVREQRWTHFMETLAQDLRYGVRGLRKSPGFTGVAVAILALGIGANTAIFSLINAVMLQKLPVRRPEQLYLLTKTSGALPAGMSNSGYGGETFSYPLFQGLRSERLGFSSVLGFARLGFDQSNVNITVDSQASAGSGEIVLGDYFSGLGLAPFMGRVLEARDGETGEPVAVVSHSFWERRLGSSASIVGKPIGLNGIAYTIVGVAPSGFTGLIPGSVTDVWVPFTREARIAPWGGTHRDPSLRLSDKSWWISVVGRLNPGVGPEQARQQLDGLLQQNLSASITSAEDAKQLPHIQLEPAGKGLDHLRKQLSKPLAVLMSIVGLVLLIACGNVATMLLARGASRQAEIGIRLALGASRLRLVRQLLTESILLAGVGAAAGWLLAVNGTPALAKLMPSAQTVTLSVDVDAKVLAFTLAVSLLTGLLFGLAPALLASRGETVAALRQSAIAGGRSWFDLRNLLVVTQVALSLLLLISAGLFLRTLENLTAQEMGFNRDNLLLFELDPTRNGYRQDRLIGLYGNALRQLQSLPGVTSVSFSRNALLSGWVNSWPMPTQGGTAKPGSTEMLYENEVGPRFFETMGMRILLGRGIEERDTPSAPRVAVVNETLARKFFGDGLVIGRGFPVGPAEPAIEYEVVGVVQDAKYDSLRRPPQPTVYLPYTQSPFPMGSVHFAVRTARNPAAVMPSVRALMHRLDPDLALLKTRTQAEQINESISQERMFAQLAGFFGVLGLLLVAIGLYGTLAYMVNRGTREIGVRMALGAGRGEIMRRVLRQSLSLVLAGAALGLPAAWASTKVAGSMVSGLLFGLKAADPATMLAAVVLLLSVCALTSYLPARRAAHVDPMVALRHE